MRFSLFLLLASLPEVVSQFAPPFIPLNGLFATSQLRSDMARYRTSVRAASEDSRTMDDMVSVMDRARECADRFGECDLEEMEEIRRALHTERLRDLLTSSSDPTWPSSELDHRRLEEDLTLQLTLIREHIGSDEMMSDLSDVERVDAMMSGMDSDEAVGDISSLESEPQPSDPPVDASELRMASGGERRRQVAMPRGGGGGGGVRTTADAVPVPVPLSDAVAPGDHARWSPWVEDFAVEGWKAFDLGLTESVAIAVTVLLVLLLPSTVHHGIM